MRRNLGASLIEMMVSVGILGILIATFMGYYASLPSKLGLISAYESLPNLTHATHAYLETLSEADFKAPIEGSFYVTDDEVVSLKPSAAKMPYSYRVLRQKHFSNRLHVWIQLFWQERAFFEYPYCLVKQK